MSQVEKIEGGEYRPKLGMEDKIVQIMALLSQKGYYEEAIRRREQGIDYIRRLIDKEIENG